jgi:hypothetical protein
MRHPKRSEGSLPRVVAACQAIHAGASPPKKSGPELRSRSNHQ